MEFFYSFIYCSRTNKLSMCSLYFNLKRLFSLTLRTPCCRTAPRCPWSDPPPLRRTRTPTTVYLYNNESKSVCPSVCAAVFSSSFYCAAITFFLLLPNREGAKKTISCGHVRQRGGAGSTS